ncbi:hypothetical protein GCM10028819_28460 [Spirosoma humi]
MRCFIQEHEVEWMRNLSIRQGEGFYKTKDHWLDLSEFCLLPINSMAEQAISFEQQNLKSHANSTTYIDFTGS